jgi:propanol-preferring alcohol dehydrogenase
MDAVRIVTGTAVQRSSIDDARQVIALAADGRVRVQVDEYPLADVAQAYAALDAGTLRGRALVVP